MFSSNKNKAPENLTYKVFVFLFVLAYIMDMPSTVAIFPSNFRFTPGGIISFFVVLTGFWALLKPSSILRVSIFFIFMLSDIVDALPRSPNHVVFEGFIILSFFFSLAAVYIREKEISAAKLSAYFFPLVRLEIIILYFWAAIHKFNDGFFDTAISCATIQIFNINEVFPIIPTPEWFIQINPHFTVIIESLIPILLLIPQTRKPGILLGIFFHFVLGLRYSGFTVMVYAIYAVFITEDGFKHAFLEVKKYKDMAAAWFGKYTKYPDWQKTRLDYILTQIVFIVALIELFQFFFKGSRGEYMLISRTGLYMIICALVTFLFVYLFLIKDKLFAHVKEISFVPKALVLLIIPALVFINGFLPHMGVKNVQVKAMFSNLRTAEGKTNHYFIPASFQISNNLSDLVEIVGSNIKGLNKFSGYTNNSPLAGTSVKLPRLYVKYMEEKGEDYRKRFEYKIPYIHFQSMMTRIKERGYEDIKLEYERNGENIYTRNAELEEDITSLSLLKIKLLGQRAIPDDERGLCMW